MPYVTRSGVEVFYHDTGGRGPAVVFGHGFFMDSEMFTHQERFLGDHGYRVICWDARGHGRTKADPRQRFSYWDLADDCLAVMDAAGVEAGVLAGMSQGGYSALRVALTAPERVRALVLLGTEAGASNDAEKLDYRNMFDAWCDPDIPLDPIAHALAPRLIGGSSADHAPWMTKWAASDRPAIRAAAQCLIDRESVTDRLSEITCPALVIRGEHDESSTAAKSAALQQGLPAAEPVVTIAGAGHAAPLTHPDPVNAAMLRFIARVVPANAPNN